MIPSHKSQPLTPRFLLSKMRPALSSWDRVPSRLTLLKAVARAKRHGRKWLSGLALGKLSLANDPDLRLFSVGALVTSTLALLGQL